MKTYLQISDCRTVNIKVILDDKEVIFEGMSDDAPDEIKKLKWSKVQGSYPMEFYVYSELNKN
ncbi:MAG: hypothetical protein HFJ45_03000 [Clostridia bacterium]|nr:hypothetical protein [Clostridia bacterium]